MDDRNVNNLSLSLEDRQPPPSRPAWRDRPAAEGASAVCIADAVDCQSVEVIIDMTNATLIDCSTLNVFTHAHPNQNDKGTAWLLQNAAPNAVGVLD
jgi:hypothetical protein